jgi:hypothetical protein
MIITFIVPMDFFKGIRFECTFLTPCRITLRPSVSGCFYYQDLTFLCISLRKKSKYNGSDCHIEGTLVSWSLRLYLSFLPN